MADNRKPDPLSTLRGHLEAHSRDHRALMLGLAPTLRALQAATDELERRVGLVAAAHLQLLLDLMTERTVGQERRYPFLHHPAQLEELGSMNDRAGMVARELLKLQAAVNHKSIGPGAHSG